MLNNYRIHLVGLLVVLSVTFVSVPVSAQSDFSGGWDTKIHEDSPDRAGGPEIGDYTGLPINDAARLRGDTWDAEELEALEHLCQKPSSDYSPRGPANMRIWSEMDPFGKEVIAWHEQMSYMFTERTIYMDGRPHPSPNAPHTSQGFSTGEWEGNMLKVTTTHLKEGKIRRNGIARSASGTLIEYYVRHHGVLTLIAVTKDPAYLTEPLVRTTSWVIDENFQLNPKHDQCIPIASVPHPIGFVAFHLPGKNPWLTEFASRWNIPVEAVRGGAETMYPEYQQKLVSMPPPPPLAAGK